jgi:hypothetical protein
MTTVETWPDGTPKRRSFNAEAWAGERPLVEPDEPAAIGVGDLVALREPVDDNGDPVVKGVVLDVRTNEDGEKLVCVAREIRRQRDGNYTDIKWEYLYEEHPASAFDPAWHIPTTVFDRTTSNSAAGKIAVAVGHRHVRGGTWDRNDRLLLAGALFLADLPRTPQTTPAVEEGEWERTA